MSKNESEKGTLKLPSAAWAKFKKALQTGMAKHLTADYELAVKLHAALVEQKKGKRGFDLYAAFNKEFYTETDNPRARWTYGEPDRLRKYPFAVADEYMVRIAVLGQERPPSLRKPQKKLFPIPTSATLHFSHEAADLTLDNEKRELRWDVDDGNRNVERAHKSALGTLLFSLLKEVKWTRDTGGTFVGNDEYHREAGEEREGGGGNYVTQRFGPRGEFKIPTYALPRRRAAKPAGATSGKRS